MKNEDQIKKQIVELTFLRGLIAIPDPTFSDEVRSVALAELDGQIKALNWVIGNKPFNASKYGA